MNGEKLSCGIVLARRENDDWLTLLLRAYHHWDFPKGIVEDGEDPMHAALREVEEETGIDEGSDVLNLPALLLELHRGKR